MACRAPDSYYVAKQLQEITNCSLTFAEELLAESKNDIMLAVEKFFSLEIELETEKAGNGRTSPNCSTGIGQFDEVRDTNTLEYQAKKGDDGIITTRPRLRRKPSAIRDMNKNKISFQDIEVEEEMMQEVVAISIAEAFPNMEKETINFMVAHFKGRQDELMKYLESHVVPTTQDVGNLDCGYSVVKVLSDGFFSNPELRMEFEIVRDEFLRMTKPDYFVTSIDIIRNKKLDDLFEVQKSVLKSQGFSDSPYLLFPFTNPLDVEEVLENNFKRTEINIGFSSTFGVEFTERPILNCEQREILMCLVLVGGSSTDWVAGNIVVNSVGQILPKYVVHFHQEREVVEY